MELVLFLHYLFDRVYLGEIARIDRVEHIGTNLGGTTVNTLWFQDNVGWQFIRLRRRPRACPWLNAQTINMLRRDVAPKLRRITAS
jgi:hypothetical protein